MRERNQIASAMEAVQKLETEVADAIELIELAEADNDAVMIAEAMASLRAAAAHVYALGRTARLQSADDRGK
jgi:peptide chain release factor 2